jgi:hypothetical protein
MGLGNKAMLHLQGKYALPIAQGMKLGADLTENAPIALKLAAAFGGYAIGTVVGVMRVWNPLDIADSLLTPEAELEERLEKQMKALGPDL